MEKAFKIKSSLIFMFEKIVKLSSSKIKANGRIKVYKSFIENDL